MKKIGFTIGKFAPLHKGHEYLIETALKETDELYIVILLIMFLDWFIQFKNIKESTNLRRFITGNLAGIAQISLFIELIIFFIK